MPCVDRNFFHPNGITFIKFITKIKKFYLILGRTNHLHGVEFVLCRCEGLKFG